MTTTPAQPPSDRLDRIEAILAETAKQQQINTAALAETRALTESNAAALAETRAIADSNARAIEAWAAEGRSTEAKCTQIDDALVTWRQQSQADDAAIKANMRSISNLAMTLDEYMTNLSASVQNLIEENRENTRQHADFRARFDAMLQNFNQQMRQIWQRLSA